MNYPDGYPEELGMGDNPIVDLKLDIQAEVTRLNSMLLRAADLGLQAHFRPVAQPYKDGTILQLVVDLK